MIPDRLTFHWDSIFTVGDENRLDVATDLTVGDDDPEFQPVKMFIKHHGLVLWRDVTNNGDLPRLRTYVPPHVRREDIEPAEMRCVSELCRFEIELSRKWALMVAKAALSTAG